MKYESLFDNGLFQSIKIEEEFIVNGETKLVKRNLVRRPPGIRAILVDKKKKTKEYRYELKKWDYRLPGGKVFDNIEEYKKSLDNNTVLENVERTVHKEVKEEVGIEINNQSLFKITTAGSSVIWDFILLRNN